ncbi:MAG: carotenoid biosynthesis protein [Chloroflexaceae bacterium]|nr:carotenoid biosynthesis protein [Chloroflexaceae bacterium]
MKYYVAAERFCLLGHLLSMVFGLAGLLWVIPHPEFIARLPAIGLKAFSWSMAGGGAVYMVLGMVAVAIYAYRTLGVWHWLSFMIPSIVLSLGSELLGTSTGFPFGHYHYLSGLGYKIAGLVPFTIPLSWFYLGFCAYLIARAGLMGLGLPNWARLTGAIVLGALMLTCWDFVLDPAMSQASVPFWEWEQPGAFFGMPYQNFAGWFGTGALFMAIATGLWQARPLVLPQNQLVFPLVVYLSNFAFAAVMSLGSGFYIPVLLGLGLGIAPMLILFGLSQLAPLGKEDSLSVELVGKPPWSLSVPLLGAVRK